jgi:hypothetical protein
MLKNIYNMNNISITKPTLSILIIVLFSADTIITFPIISYSSEEENLQDDKQCFDELCNVSEEL